MGVVNMRGQRWQYEADHESHRETCDEADRIRKMRNVHDLRDDRGQAGAVKTDVNGNAGLYDLPKGFYQVVETEPPQGYLRDEQVHEVYIDPTADPTQLIREVNIANTKKLSIRIVKIDKETKVPLSGWKFDVYYNDAHLTTVTTNQNG